MPTVLIIDDDLFFSARIESILKRLGYAPQIIARPEEALLIAEMNAPALVIVNFASRNLEAAETVRKLKSLSGAIPVLTFMPHKQMPELKPLARAAGADLVVANSALNLRLPQLVAKLAPLDGGAIAMEEAVAIAEESEEE